MTRDHDRPQRWRDLAASTLALGSVAALLMAVAVLAPELRERFDLSVGAVGMMLACPELGIAATLLLWGVSVDRRGERIPLLVGLIGAGVATLGAASSLAPMPFYAALLVAGICASAVVTASPILVMRTFRGQEEGAALAVRQTAVPFAGAAVVLALVPVAQRFGTEVALFIVAGAMLGAAALVAAWVRPAPSMPLLSDRGRLARVTEDRRVWLVCVAGGILLAGQTIASGFAMVYLVDVWGMGESSAMLALAAMLVVAVALLIGIGAAVRHRPRGYRDALTRRISHAVALGFGCSCVLDLAGWVGASVALTVTGAVSFGWLPLLTARLGELVSSSQHGVAVALQQTAFAVPAALAPIAFGLGVEALSWSAAFGVLAAAMTVPAFLVRALDADRPSSLDRRSAAKDDRRGRF